MLSPADRFQALYLFWTTDIPLAEIGEKFGVSRQAIDQMVNRVPGGYEYKKVRRMNRKDTKEEKAKEVREARKKERLIKPVPCGAWSRNQLYTDEELLDQIRDFVKRHGRIPVSYPCEVPTTSATFFKRFGSWNNAVRLAGFKPNESSSIPRFYSDEDLVGRVVDFLDDAEEYSIEHDTIPKVGYQAYEDWRKENLSEDYPIASAALLRIRFGTWTEIKKQAIAIREARET